MAKFYLCLILLLFCIYVDAGIGPILTIDACLQSKKVGPGRAAIPRYYYDKNSKVCKSFLWGGVQPNGNNFATKADCADRCICRAPRKTGPCRALFYRYYYNRLTRRCHRFIYGGCGANANNFRTRRACERTCRPRLDRYYSG